MQKRIVEHLVCLIYPKLTTFGLENYVEMYDLSASAVAFRIGKVSLKRILFVYKYIPFTHQILLAHSHFLFYCFSFLIDLSPYN